MRTCLAGFSALLLFSAVAPAQDPALLRRFEQDLDEIRRSHFESRGGLTITEHGRLLYGAYTTFSLTGADDLTGHTRVLRQGDGKLWAQGETGGHTLYGRIRLQYQDFNSGDSFTGRGDGFLHPFGDRYWYRYGRREDVRARTGEDPGWDWWVQVGRQYVHWLSGFTLSAPLYAVRAGVATDAWRFEALFAVTPDSFIDFDATRPGFLTNTDRRFWGASVEYTGLTGHRPYAYFLAEEDNNSTTMGPARWFYESWYAAVGSSGQIVTGAWLYRVELVYEGGDSAADVFSFPVQTVDDIEAWALRFMVAHMPPALRASRGLRFELELLIGSGDDDRLVSDTTAGGNLAGTDDEAFNAFGFVNTGLAFAPPLANVVSVRLGASALPWKGHGLLDRLRLAVDVFYFSKLDDDAPIHTFTMSGESDLGFEVDFTLDWILTSDAAVDLRYGIFVPGDAFFDDDVLHFVYAGFSYGF